MSVNMADEARRRELRRKRILENAEERKRKIFGVSINAKDTAEPVENAIPTINNVLASDPQKKDEPDFTSKTFSNSTISSDLGSTSSSNSRNRRECTNINQSRFANFTRIQNGTVPDLSEQPNHFSRLMTTNGGISSNSVQNGRIQEDVQPVDSVERQNSSMVLIVLALSVCFLLSSNFGYIVSNSISIPFMLWEASHLWCQRNAIQARARSGAGLFGIALMLCGVQQTTVTIYAHLITIVKCFLEDFALYILTVVFWCTVIGLPGVLQSEPLESPIPTLMNNDVTDDADIYSMEEF
ncbi:uncharacterized protein [Cherax quadricarinatus]|nr:uncharacterized protein LOC128700197 isoform X1 [Cherax quadricarinatus]